MYHISNLGGFETSNFMQVPLQPSCADSCLKPHPLSLNSHGSWPMVALRSKKRASPPEIEALQERNGPPSTYQELSTAM